MRFHRLKINAVFGALMGLAIAISPCFADDKLPVKDDAAKSEEAEQSDPEKKESTPGKPSLLDKLSKELFKDLEDDPAKAPAAKKENKLDSVAKGMRSAGEKLDEDQTGTDTRKIQEQVIRDLDELIKQLQNPPPPPQGNSGGGGGNSSSGGGSSGSSAMKSGQAQRGQGGRGQQGKAQANAGANQSKGNGQDKKVAEGSQERTESERKAAEEAARKKKLEMDVWGHLPPHLRDQLLNTYGDRTLPKYQNLVKQFYEALSEQSDTAPRR